MWKKINQKTQTTSCPRSGKHLVRKLVPIPYVRFQQFKQNPLRYFMSTKWKTFKQENHTTFMCKSWKKLKVGLSTYKKFVFIYFNNSSLKMMKNDFSLMLKALFVLEIFTFLSWLFWLCKKRLDKKARVNFKIYVVTDWKTNNCNTHIAQCLKK